MKPLRLSWLNYSILFQNLFAYSQTDGIIIHMHTGCRMDFDIVCPARDWLT
jgi:hypothetical protein